MKYLITERQYRLLTEENLSTINEGRKEDVTQKYKQKFKEYPSVISDVLNNDVITRTNYKYADFLLNNLHPNSDEYEISDAIALINKFDKNQQNLEKQDINQYNDLEDLENSVNLYMVSKREKADVEKIYGNEDDRYLVIIPKNEAASCKYGANTKWCVTSKGSGHFERYTLGKQLLYFIIDKKNSTDTEFSKVAVHVSNFGKFTYYDSKDQPLSEKEIRLLKYAIPDAIKAIEDDYEKKNQVKNVELYDVFTDDYFDTNTLQYETPDVDDFLTMALSGFDTHGLGYASASLDVFLYDISDRNKLIDKYELFITYNELSKKTFSIQVDISGWDGHIDENNFIDLGLGGEELSYYPITFENTEKDTAKKVRQIILGEVYQRLLEMGVSVGDLKKNEDN